MTIKLSRGFAVKAKAKKTKPEKIDKDRTIMTRMYCLLYGF